MFGEQYDTIAFRSIEGEAMAQWPPSCVCYCVDGRKMLLILCFEPASDFALTQFESYESDSLDWIGKILICERYCGINIYLNDGRMSPHPISFIFFVFFTKRMDRPEIEIHFRSSDSPKF